MPSFSRVFVENSYILFTTLLTNNRKRRLLTDYIHYSPVKHGLVDMGFDGKFSSFRKIAILDYYDENWCNFNQLKDYQ